MTHKPVSALLNMEVINADHAAANSLQGVVERWQCVVEHRFIVEFFVTDNASDTVKALSDGGFEHIRRMAHCLHLVVAGALKECQGVVHIIIAGRKIQLIKPSHC